MNKERETTICRNCNQSITEHLMVQGRPRYCQTIYTISVYQQMDALELVEFYEEAK